MQSIKHRTPINPNFIVVGFFFTTNIGNTSTLLFNWGDTITSE